MNILVSACLLGASCRYDGASKGDPRLEALRAQGHTLVPVCPEVLGGLPTPRPPAELQKDGRVVNREGVDVTAEYRAGAERALKIARAHGCTCGVLKERSPSCGSGQVYDGTFTPHPDPRLRGGGGAALRPRSGRVWGVPGRGVAGRKT